MNTVVCMKRQRYIHRYKQCSSLLCFLFIFLGLLMSKMVYFLYQPKTFLFLKSLLFSPLIILQILQSRRQCWLYGQWRRGFAVLKE